MFTRLQMLSDNMSGREGSSWSLFPHSLNSHPMNSQVDWQCVRVSPFTAFSSLEDRIHEAAAAAACRLVSVWRYGLCFRQRDRQRESKRGCEHAFPPTLIQPVSSLFLLSLHCFDLVLGLRFGCDSLSYSAPDWKTCSASGAGYAGVKSISCCIYLLKSHSCLCSLSVSVQVSFQHYV